jgi:hypothetical protein
MHQNPRSLQIIGRYYRVRREEFLLLHFARFIRDSSFSASAPAPNCSALHYIVFFTGRPCERAPCCPSEAQKS